PRLLSDVRDPETARRQLGSGEAQSVRIEHRKAALAVVKDWVNLVRL
ncbi:unnamed protein product, partial [marine sediment metagenome]